MVIRPLSESGASTDILIGASRLRSGWYFTRRDEKDHRPGMILRTARHGGRRGSVYMVLSCRTASQCPSDLDPSSPTAQTLPKKRDLFTSVHVSSPRSPHPIGTPSVACPPPTPDLTGGGTKKGPKRGPGFPERGGGKGRWPALNTPLRDARSGPYRVRDRGFPV